jgi:hypothetical protein
MTPLEFIMSPWNEEKIAAYIAFLDEKKKKEEDEHKTRIELLITKIDDLNESIKILEKTFEEIEGNEEIEDWIFKELKGLYPLRRKKVKALVNLGELKFIVSKTNSGKKEIFKIEDEDFSIQNKIGKYYKISVIDSKPWKHFVFKILILDEKILIYYIDNQGFEEVTGKGIVKSMIEGLRKKYNMKIVSSTNKENLKIDDAEGRVPNVTEFWKKWVRENSKIRYNVDEDRFEYEL